MRAHGEGTLYRRSDGRWCAQISISRDDGTPARRTVYGRTQAEARAKQVAARREAAAGVTRTSRPPTVAEYAKTWLAMKRDLMSTGHLTRNTLTSYEDLVTLHIEPLLGHRRLDELNRDVLTKFVIKKQEMNGGHGKPLSARTVEMIHGRLKDMLSEAVADGLIPANPMARVRAPRKQHKPIVPLTQREVGLLLAGATQDRLAALWITLLTTGLRIGEALALTWADLDLDRRLISITKGVGPVSGDRDPVTGRRTYELMRKGTKTPASEALVAMPTTTALALAAHQRQQELERSEGTRWAENDLVFTTPVGTVLDNRNLGRTFAALVARSGINRPVRIHDLRHAAASALLAEGIDIGVVKGVLRHTRIATTSDIYAHLLEETKHHAADAMELRIQRTLQSGGTPVT